MANYVVSLSPAQRWALFPLLRGEHQKIPAGKAGAFRRTFAALALDRIESALRKNRNNVALHAVTDDEPRLFKVSTEALEYLDQVVGPQDKTPGQVLALGELLDFAKDPGAGSHPIPEGAPFDPEADDWTPPEPEGKPSLISCPHCGQDFSPNPPIGAAEMPA